MNITQFNTELENINQASYGYANEILYLMARNPDDLTDKEKLTGAIMLIGRAYAASPQRRSYGTKRLEEEYFDASGNKKTTAPIWPIRTQNDGRSGFFDEIADTMENSLSQREFKDLTTSATQEYEYNCSDTDIDKLTTSIQMVLQYNLYLSKALEKFDEVPANNKFKNKTFYCSNHISFASKFLHFYFPHHVFIIDTFARNGGKNLFSKYSENKPRTFYNPPSSTSDNFEEEIYNKFTTISRIYNKISQKDEIKAINEGYRGRSLKKSNNSNNDNDLSVKDYIEHAIRSYLLGCYMKNNANITPINHIKYDQTLSIRSMPRITDAVFLNIKAPLTKSLKKHYRSVQRIYHVTYLQNLDLQEDQSVTPEQN